MKNERDIQQTAQTTSAKLYREDTVRATQLRQRAAECRKAGLHTAARKLEYEADRCST
ncbi:hypothetical protein [Shimia sagamensis]|uniref:Transposase n=1 Tax=Shimia sagamensis TaxID=1566352 RepID=A0ABY1PJB7_9RHOB|nr:hypothetical protein [Shimia sagamensis]SMP35339.1 hypothetical protein SAMN06265373_11173 [Shimia sagamensis]